MIVTAFGFVPLQLGRFAVEVTQLSVAVAVELVTFSAGWAVVQASTALWTLAVVALGDWSA